MNGSSDIVQPSPAHPTGAITTSTAALARYYRWHARLYDATRWSFLFGRAELIRAIAGHHSPSNLSAEPEPTCRVSAISSRKLP